MAQHHSYLIRAIVAISFQLHFICLNWAVDLPDYSAYLNDSESFKLVTHLLCLLFGYLGLSTQISFTLDLLCLFSFPFRICRTIYTKSYFFLLWLNNAVVDILTIEVRYWVTCPYPKYLLKDSFKMVYICALPLLFSLLAVAKIYSLLMSAVLVLFKTTIVNFML